MKARESACKWLAYGNGVWEQQVGENSLGESVEDSVVYQCGANERANQPRLRVSQETNFYWSSLPPKAQGKKKTYL